MVRGLLRVGLVAVWAVSATAEGLGQGLTREQAGVEAAGPPSDSLSTAFNFRSVPPIRPAPRAGPFTIPPAGYGPYSLLAAVRGDWTDGPPRSGYPAFALFPLSYFDADWRYLDDPSTPPRDRLEELKRLHLGDRWLLSTGGSAWVRFMNEYNSRLTQTDNNYALSRTRLYADLWYEDRLRVYTEGIFAYSVWQDLLPAPTDENKADFLNLFADVKVAEVGGRPAYIRGGRQELLFGSQRLVSPLEWANTRRTFQGVRGMWSGETVDVDAFWVRPVLPSANTLDGPDHNQNFAGAWLTYRPRPGTAADLYYLMLDNANDIVQQGIIRASFTRHTFGGRFAGDRDGTLLWDFEAAQLGRVADNNLVAGMATAGLGYHCKERPWNPIVWAYYDYASGDATPNIGTAHTFNPLFPFGHNYLGWADLVGRSNIHDANAHLYLYPVKWVTVWLQCHNFWLADPRDAALYNAANNAIRRDPTGAAGRYVGTEVDTVLNFHLTSGADVLVGYSYLFGGSFLRATSGPDAAVNASVLFVKCGLRW